MPPRDAASTDVGESTFIHEHNEARSSGVSWGAVVAGAFVAAAFYLILLALGAGLGLSSVSPWSNHSGAVIGAAAIVWLIFIEVVASTLGGYLTGRLRTKWAVIHDDEVYFRDTANGFLAWAVALIVTVTFLASSAASMAGNSAPVQSTSVVDPNAYYVDLLFRSDRGTEADPAVRAEASRIMANASLQPDVPSADRTHLARVIAARTNITTADADRRITEVMTDARQAADTARKAAARFLLWMFLALIMGAFAASYSATLGGRQRDHVLTH
jgi:hypothetical protein